MRTVWDPAKSYMQVDLSWEDWERLEAGRQIGDRYDTSNKVLIDRSHPIPNGVTWTEFPVYAPEGHYDRNTMDINLKVPHQDLRNSWVHAVVFSEKGGNLYFSPDGAELPEMKIRVTLPGSVQNVNVPDYFP